MASVMSAGAQGSSPGPRHITHVLFDMDGLLLDTEGFYTSVQQDLCKRYDRVFTWDLKAKMIGKKAAEAAQVLIDELDLAGQLTPAQFLEQREAALDSPFPTCQLLPGAERLLRHLAAAGVPFCLATSSHARHYTLKTTLHGPLFELFAHRVTGDMVENGKPHPEIFLTAAAMFKPPADPATCLVFEDAPTGVEAAKTAGMWAVMVPDPQLPRGLTGRADQVLASLAEFVPQDWGLPPFSATTSQPI